jgi:biopolymer transport protein ExbB/TolQ
MELHFEPLFANALQFAFEKATPEGKVTITLLAIVSLISWTVILTKGRQLYRASKAGRGFFAAYCQTRDPLELFNRQEEYDGAPAYEVYAVGAEELAYQLKYNPVAVNSRNKASRLTQPRDHARVGQFQHRVCHGD